MPLEVFQRNLVEWRLGKVASLTIRRASPLQAFYPWELTSLRNSEAGPFGCSRHYRRLLLLATSKSDDDVLTHLLPIVIIAGQAFQIADSWPREGPRGHHNSV